LRAVYHMKLIFQDVRTFAGRHQVDICPLTVLVGENSSGKSTFLGLLAAACSSGFPFSPQFNEPPYDLGNFETVVTAKSLRGKRPRQFYLGVSDSDAEIIGSYVGARGQIRISHLASSNARGSIDLTVEHNTCRATLTRPHVPDLSFEFTFPQTAASTIPAAASSAILRAMVPDADKSISVETILSKGWFSAIDAQVMTGSLMRFQHSQAISVAPIRTKPRRNYDQYSDDFTPEGDHIPLLLAHVWQSEIEDSKSRLVKQALVEFGRDSGLFTDVTVRQLGKIGEPFQLKIATNGLRPTIADVGYGVSQALPIIVQSVASPANTLLLLQQPEVHLHPKAQAALGSFFVRLVAANRQFVVETHSDYLLDRIRREVAAKAIPASAVSILFFENRSGRSKIHRLELDDLGNIVKPPRSYRRFFLEEELGLLGR
jgi:hypothetical protein